MTEEYMTDWELLEDLFEERAAIIEYEGGYERYVSENMAAQCYGFSNRADLKLHIQRLKAQ